MKRAWKLLRVLELNSGLGEGLGLRAYRVGYKGFLRIWGRECTVIAQKKACTEYIDILTVVKGPGYSG